MDIKIVTSIYIRDDEYENLDLDKYVLIEKHVINQNNFYEIMLKCDWDEMQEEHNRKAS